MVRPTQINGLGIFLNYWSRIFRSSAAEWFPALSLRCIVKTVGDPLSEGVTGAVQCIIAGAVESVRKFKGNVCSLKLQEKYSIVLVKIRDFAVCLL